MFHAPFSLTKNIRSDIIIAYFVPPFAVLGFDSTALSRRTGSAASCDKQVVAAAGVVGVAVVVGAAAAGVAEGTLFCKLGSSGFHQNGRPASSSSRTAKSGCGKDA